VLEPVAWTDAFERVAEGLREARDNGGVGVLAGGRLTVEDAYAYSKFARVALGTNDVDFRARPHSVEEAEFLAAHVAGVTPENGGVTYDELATAPAVLLVGFDPEEESPIVFLRLRKAWRNRGLRVFGIAPLASPGLVKMGGTLIQAVPGAEPKVLDALTGGGSPGGKDDLSDVSSALGAAGAVILVGERLASVPGGLSAAARLADISGARLAWVPRRAGERGAIDAGLLPNLLPGSRPVADPTARAELERAWGLDSGSLPAEAGRDTAGILAAAANGELAALVVGGVDPNDLPDPAAAEAALDAAGFVVSLELRASAVTAHADVVLPVAPAVEKIGAYVDWEGRERAFGLTLEGTGALTDARILDTIAAEYGVDLELSDVISVRADRAALPATAAPRPVLVGHPVGSRPQPSAGEAILATWHHLLDLGSMQDGEEHLAGTARVAVARLSPATAAEIGAVNGQPITVATDRGAITLPLAITEMPDRVVWVPTNSVGSAVRRELAADTGALVRISAAAVEPAAEQAVTPDWPTWADESATSEGGVQ
jgi:NADH-quinone oxidoreductase subunit G